MRRTLGVGVVLLLLAVLSPDSLLAQTQGNTTRRESRTKGNYPNPFNPTTTIPFAIWEEDLASGKPAVVTIRIYNQLLRLVAVPIAENHPNGNAARVENLPYATAGDKLAYWDGTDRTGQKVASGVYYYIVVVNGEKTPPKRMIVSK